MQRFQRNLSLWTTDGRRTLVPRQYLRCVNTNRANENKCRSNLCVKLQTYCNSVMFAKFLEIYNMLDESGEQEFHDMQFIPRSRSVC